MSSIFESRIFYNWRMAKRGGAYLCGSLGAAGASGSFVAAASHEHGMAPIGITPLWGLVGFVTCVLVAAILWWRFSSLQDEMFHRIQNYSYGWGGTVSIAVLIVWGVANAASLAPPISPIAPLLVFAICKSFFWTVATRKWL